jgi:hypothetical protein
LLARRAAAVSRPGRAGLAAAGRHAQQVLPPAHPEGLDRVGELAVHRPGAQDRCSAAHHLPMQRVGQAQLEPTSMLFDNYQAAAFERFDAARAGELLNDLEAEWFAGGDQLQDGPLGALQATESSLDHVAKAGGRIHRTTPPPDAVALSKLAVLTPGQQQLAKQEAVAQGRRPEPVQGEAVDLPAKHRADQLLDLRARQRLQLEPLGEPVLPQGKDRIGYRLAAAKRRQDEHRRCGCELVEQGRRTVVQQVGVVDPEHEPPRAGLPFQRCHGSAEELRLIRYTLAEDGEQLGERPQRDRRCRLGGNRPAGRKPPCARRPEHFAGQPGLADAGLSGDDDAGSLGAVDPVQDGRKLLIAADQRPSSPKLDDLRHPPHPHSKPSLWAVKTYTNVKREGIG